MLKFRFAKSSDTAEVRGICQESFELSSINTDAELNLNAGEYLYNNYAKRAVEDHPSNCFIAERSGAIEGFLIFGVDAEMGRRLKCKIGNIILFAVRKRKQNSGIGKALLNVTLNHFKKHGFALIHVGTDMDNTPALHCYQSAGFKNIFSWATLRAYGKFTKDEDEPCSVHKLDSSELEDGLLNMNFSRNHSFFYDNRIDKEQALEKHKQLIREGHESGLLRFYKISHNSNTAAFISLRNDPWLSESTGKGVVRVEDFIFTGKYENSGIIIKSAVRFALSLEEADVREAWCALNRFSLMNALIREGFSYVHSAAVLHLWL